jgi:hypothetical protein
MTPADYFREKIERRVAFYEAQSRQIDDKYLAEVKKLAARTRDPVLAEHFRETMKPGRIAAALDHIRALLREGEIIEADQCLEMLQTNLEFVESHLRHPYFRAGAGTKLGGKKGADAKWASYDRSGRHSEIRTVFEREVGNYDSIGEAEKAIARRFKVCSRTVRTARTGK